MFAKFHGKSVEVFSVVIEEIQFLKAVTIQPNGNIDSHKNKKQLQLE